MVLHLLYFLSAGFVLSDTHTPIVKGAANCTAYKHCTIRYDYLFGPTI